MRTVVTVARNENIYFFRWESIANWVLMLSQYFGSSFKTRSAPIMIRLFLEPIYEQGACFLKRSASFWNESFSSKRLFELDLFTFEITSNNKIELCQSPKTGKTMKTREIFWKSKNQKMGILGNVIRKAHAKFQEARSIGNIKKLRGTIQWREYC